MKKLYTLVVLLTCLSTGVFAQTIDELKAQKAELAAAQAEAQAKADALKGEIGGLQDQIDILSGWTTGLAGNVGFDFNNSNNWVAAPNPNATSSGIGVALTAFANKMSEKTMFRNKLIANKAWQDIDGATIDGQLIETREDGLFDNATVDILNISSLYGYRVHPKFAISALGELNSSISNFLSPGTVDIGVGGTWTPSNNLVVVIHPLNYNLTWAAEGSGFEQAGGLGCKVRADYTNTYNIAGKDFGLSSTLTGFLPYGNNDPDPSLFNYTWVNSVSFSIWRGIGVGVGFGFRGSEIESSDIQRYYNVGLSYNI